jgi:hypothetical protein
MPVYGADKFTLELERDIPQEAQQQGAHIVIPEQQSPKGVRKFLAQLILLKFPGNRTASLGYEHLLKKPGIIHQALLQQPYLLPEQCD